MALISPPQSSPGDEITAAAINGPVNTIANEFNGNIENVNIKDDAAISASKLASKSILPDNLADDAVYKLIKRVTLPSSGTSITVSDIPPRNYLRVVLRTIPTGGTIRSNIRFNNDSGSNYSMVSSDSFGSPADTNSASSINLSDTAVANPEFAMLHVNNLASIEKLIPFCLHRASTAGASNPPRQRQGLIKWSNTSNQVTEINIGVTGTGQLNTGSEVLVYGAN